MQLPAVMSDAVQSQVIDVTLMTRLSSSKTINWCRTVRPMYPLRASPPSRPAGTVNSSHRTPFLLSYYTDLTIQHARVRNRL